MTVNPPELEDAIARHRLGHAAEAEAVYRAFTENQPELSEPWHMLGVVHLQRGEPALAEPLFREALKRTATHVKCLSNLGGALYQLGRYEEAERELSEALRLEPDYINAIYNLGNTLLALGRSDEAVSAYRKTVTLQPHFPEAYNNLAEAQKRLGLLDEATLTLQAELQRDTPQGLLNDAFIALLNDHMPKHGLDDNSHVKAQRLLQCVELGSDEASLISDQTVKRVYQQCHDILSAHKVRNHTLWTQIWRGKNNDLGCDRHKLVFDTHNVIPEYCFGCYKVSIDVQNVIDLFKLLIVFSTMKLQNDNTRKCLIETRPEIKGAYKGLIYCENLEEAQKILAISQKAVQEKISDNVTVAIKRGCSEFPLAYPEYGRLGSDGLPVMTYNEAWRRYEEEVDQQRVKFQAPLIFDTHNHPGLTVRDAVIMKTWLAYAAVIGDQSYRMLSTEPLPALPIAKRPPFAAVEKP